MRLGDKGYLQFMFPSERHFKSFGHMAEMIASLPLGLYFLSLSDSVHIVICACEKVQECLICIRRVEVILKKSSHWKLCVQSKETLSHTWWGPVRTMVAIIHLINRHSLITLEKEMATHSSILACRILWTEKPGGLPSMGLQRVGHDWVSITSLRWSPALCPPASRLDSKG